MFLAKNKRLLEAFKRGDRAAMDEVYRRYVAGVTAFLRKGFTFRSGEGHYYFKGVHDPSELAAGVQEVFRRAFERRARESYNGVNSFSNWVLAIARNMIINQFRNREIAFSDRIAPSDERGHLTIVDDEVTEEFSGLLYAQQVERQDAHLERRELERLLDRFMGELTERDRRLLLHRFAEGKGQEETAALIGSTRMKVRTAEARLRSRLRAFLRKSGFVDHVPATRAPAGAAPESGPAAEQESVADEVES